MSNNDDPVDAPESIREQMALTQLIGLSLAQFSSIEESLAVLYGISAGIPKMQFAFRTHDAIREFQYRLDATDEAVRLWIKALEDDETAAKLDMEWNALYRKIKDDSRTRNQLAHFRLFANENDDGTITWFVCPYFQILSHPSSILGVEKAKVPSGVRKFDRKSLEAKMERFDRTAKRIDRFIGRMMRLGAPLPKPF